MSQSEPVCTEATVSASVGGKVEIVKYEYYVDFHFSMTRKYDIPEDWAETDVLDFQHDKTILLREQLEVVADAEMQDLMRQRDEI